MTILEEIRDGFASMPSYGALKINSLTDEYMAYIIRIPDGYGVALPVDAALEVAETFNSCKFRTGLLSIDGNFPEGEIIVFSILEKKIINYKIFNSIWR